MLPDPNIIVHIHRGLHLKRKQTTADLTLKWGSYLIPFQGCIHFWDSLTIITFQLIIIVMKSSFWLEFRIVPEGQMKVNRRIQINRGARYMGGKTIRVFF